MTMRLPACDAVAAARLAPPRPAAAALGPRPPGPAPAPRDVFVPFASADALIAASGTSSLPSSPRSSAIVFVFGLPVLPDEFFSSARRTRSAVLARLAAVLTARSFSARSFSAAVRRSVSIFIASSRRTASLRAIRLRMPPG